MTDEKKTVAPRDAVVPIRVRAVGRRTRPLQDLYFELLTRPWWQFFGLVTLIFLGTNALFAGAYMVQPGSVANARNELSDLFFFSIQTMATIGYGNMSPATTYAHVLVTMEALVGVLGIALVTGLTFAKFARPRARVLFAEKAAIAPRDGVPHLVFRVANWRHNQILEAQLRVLLLVDEVTREGEHLRRPVELSLVRDRTALFFLTWSPMHRIDETSPFYGEDAMDRLRAQKSQLILSLSGMDETLAQTIHARWVYELDDLVAGRFADIISTHPDGTRVIDYAKFHTITPLAGSQEG
jgi:inward rectifier potassium channel